MSRCFKGSGVTKCHYIPTPEFYGKDKITYKVKDAEDLESSSVGTVFLNIDKERIPVAGDSIIKIEDKKSNALIVFALDISNSMDPYLAHMKTSVANFVDDIASRGFKATLAFIDSDDKTTTHTTSTDHATYPKETGAKVNLVKHIPLGSRVKTFEIDAYDFDWNDETKTDIANTKTLINTFIDSLPDGEDDERLLCSTVRFLHSDHAKGKDYVGVFSIANEDDAVVAADLKAAHNECIKEKSTEIVPKESCSKTVTCNYGEVGCVGEFTYYYTIQESYKKVNSKVVGQRKRKKYFYKYVPTTYAKGYDNLPKYKMVDEEQCKEEWKTADNPSGCRIVKVQVPDGTYKKNYDIKGTCADHANKIKYNCTEYTRQVKTVDYWEYEYYNVSYNGGTCQSRSYVLNCVYTPPVYDTRTANRTITSTTDKTCLDATGYDTCYLDKTWSGKYTYTATEDCGTKNLPQVVKRFDVPDVLPADQTLVKSVHHQMTSAYNKSVFVAVANDKDLNAQALVTAETKDIDLPSSDCLAYAENRTLYELDGLEFKSLATLMGDQGDFYSICSPERYPSGKLDYLVEDSQLDFLVPAYETTDDLKVNKVELSYADGTKKLLAAKDYNYNAGHIVLVDSALAKYLIEVKVTYEGYKK